MDTNSLSIGFRDSHGNLLYIGDVVEINFHNITDNAQTSPDYVGIITKVIDDQAYLVNDKGKSICTKTTNIQLFSTKVQPYSDTDLISDNYFEEVL